MTSQNILFSAEASILLKVHNQRHVPSQQQRVNDFSMQIAISISDIESPKLQNSLCTLFKVSTVESWKKNRGWIQREWIIVIIWQCNRPQGQDICIWIMPFFTVVREGKKAGFLIVMDVLDPHNSRLLHPNNRPRAAKAPVFVLYSSRFFHQHCKTQWTAHMSLNDLRFTFVLQPEQFRIRGTFRLPHNGPNTKKRLRTRRGDKNVVEPELA